MLRRNPQAAILMPQSPAARWLEFSLVGGTGRDGAESALRALAAGDARIDGTFCVVGLGISLVGLLGIHVPGLRTFPVLAGAKVDVPSAPRALWIWLRGEDRGELLHRSRRIAATLAPAFALESCVDGFVHDTGRDLSGYEDGTENPKAEDATAAAIVAAGDSCAPEGSSFVAVQQWVHDFAQLARMSKTEQDNAIGRERVTNDELKDAPESAHVKRTAQEDFEPVAFVVRRSMPWTDGMRAGLMFIAFGRTLDAFEMQLRRMAGLDDGIVDSLFSFTQPITGAYYWCPPVVGGKVALVASDLSAR
jgi:putative iron-dependent peroxidase